MAKTADNNKIPPDPDSAPPLEQDLPEIAGALGPGGIRVPPPTEAALQHAASIIHRFLGIARETATGGVLLLTPRDILGCSVTRLFFEYIAPGKFEERNGAQALLQALRDVAHLAPPELVDAAGFAVYSKNQNGEVRIALLQRNYVRWAQVLNPDRIPRTEREAVLRRLASGGGVWPRVTSSETSSALRRMRAMHDDWARTNSHGATALPVDLESLAAELAPLVRANMMFRGTDGQYRFDSKALRDPLRTAVYVSQRTLGPRRLDEIAAASNSADAVSTVPESAADVGELVPLLQGIEVSVLEAIRHAIDAGEEPNVAASPTEIARRLGLGKSKESTIRKALKRVRERARSAGLHRDPRKP